jgi:hypothetical protein
MNRLIIKMLVTCVLIGLVSVSTYAFSASEMRELSRSVFGQSLATSNPQVKDDDEQYRRDEKRIKDLLVASDLKGLMEFRRDIKDRWGTIKPKLYVSLASQVCFAFNSGHFEDAKYSIYARQCAKEILNREDDMSIDQELDMVGILMDDREYRSGVLDRGLWPKDWQERISYLLRLSNRIYKNYEQDFNIKSPPTPVVCVPAPNYRCGIRPEDVKRAGYQGQIHRSNKCE